MADISPHIQPKSEIKHLKDFDPPKIAEELLKIKRESKERLHYSETLNSLLSLYDVDFVKKLQSAHCQSSYDSIFLDGPEIDAFIVLLNNSSTGTMFKRLKCASLLEKFTEQKKITNLLESIVNSPNDIQDCVINLIGSFTSRMANLQKRELSDLFVPSNLVPKVCSSILIVIKQGVESIKNSKDFQIRAVTRLLGKLCVIGYGDYVWKTILPTFVSKADDGIWNRINYKLLSTLQFSQQESFIVSLLKNVRNERLFSSFLVNSALENTSLKNLLTVKLLLHRSDLSLTSLNVLISHFTTSPARLTLFKDAVNNLLRIWSDASALRHSTIHQRFYITRALVICAINCPQQEYFDSKALLQGVEIHLAIEDNDLRTMGMCCGEILTSKLKVSTDKLEFEYSDNEYTLELKNLEEKLAKNEEDIAEIIKNLKVEEEVETEANINSEDLDSDDDLPAYDQSNDLPKRSNKVPHYLRDCLDGLIQTQDVELTNTCLEYAVKLIQKNKSTVDEMGDEMAKVLLHISPTTEEGEIHVFQALVALIVVSPAKVTKYMTSQVYEYNYTIEKRLLMLHALSAAAKSLAFPEPAKAIEDTSKSKKNTLQSNVTDCRALVANRLEAKTRRWGSKAKQCDVRENKLSSSVSLFFYPLLTGLDVRRSYLDLLGKDHIVLTRVIYTISSIVNVARNVVTSDKMCIDLLEVIWLLRWHEEPSVKQALLYGLCVIASALNPNNLLTIVNATDVMEWLKKVMNEDSDKECRERASTSFCLFAKSFKENAST
ncbi:unnamed protein product [Dimorphilus gyrociliatus]|uniref:Telomere length regulation protein conserved domain-containing protein n=1 Tax=Dimorphilus gyrociliatus TaxID=2664684 RepID=A0A7I8W8C7_9ANNE|nr:unnamed protein product [Dimorphilus gyrociliatus]